MESEELQPLHTPEAKTPGKLLMIKTFIFATAAILTFAIPTQSEGATGNFVVTVESLSPAASPKSVPCNSGQKQCFLSLIFENDNVPIDIAVTLQSEEARFQFMQDRRYLPVRNDGQTLLIVPFKNGVGAANVDLFDPDSLEPESLIKDLS